MDWDASQQKAYSSKGSFLDAGDYDTSGAFDDNTDTYNKGYIRIVCPSCKHIFAPMRTRNTRRKNFGWRWVGCDYQEPFWTYVTCCRKCRRRIHFTTYVPQ